MGRAVIVGDRIQDPSGARGTIRYVGPVATAKDQSTQYYGAWRMRYVFYLYKGVEWDEWGRGLHDGSVTLPNGARVVHFNGPAPRSVRAGSLEHKCSFIKASKVQAEGWGQSQTLLDVLQARYGHAPDDPALAPPAPLSREQDVVITGEKPIRLVGVHKLRTQQTLDTIEKISLAHCGVTDTGITAAGQLRELTPSIVELDLAGNLLGRWSQVLDIAHELPKLETFVLSANRLEYDVNETESPLVVENVQVLVLNQTQTKWKVLQQLVARHFPNLRELFVADNAWVDDDLKPSASADASSGDLETLDLSQNRLTSWTVVQQVFGQLPNLKQLMVNDNQISSLVTTTASSTPAFQQLKSLSLTGNRIGSWTSIDALNLYPQLESLRFMRNPLTAAMGAGEARMIIIARTNTVSVFNGSDIRERERAEAEQMYLKRVLHELAVSTNDTERVRVEALHPRLALLRVRYPELQIGTANASGAASTLAASLIRVKISPMSIHATTFDSLEKKIPEKMKVSQIKLLVEKKFGVAIADQLLTYRPDPKSMPLPLDDDSCEVGYYGLQDGAEILVNDA
ncbi:TPA: hypothetical protein N0F65_013033 [Lagenidium giganteum]|uniref:Tubulin-folding cofactor E n=1 Tax=Lagenidium giganteum TaxID=4803 RepID=A0AAV2YPD6_9STRA|nr:TPA: hypothetical protein N0F65_013033 [Lagenidium giganteum]